MSLPAQPILQFLNWLGSLCHQEAILYSLPCFPYLKDKPIAEVFSNLLIFVSAVAVLMFLLAVRSQVLLQAKTKSVFSSVLWSGGFIAWCVSPGSICSLPSAPRSILMACPFCTQRLIKIEYRDEVALPWSEGEPGRGVMLQVIISFPTLLLHKECRGCLQAVCAVL